LERKIVFAKSGWGSRCFVHLVFFADDFLLELTFELIDFCDETIDIFYLLLLYSSRWLVVSTF
jgi:hypothetical protein